MPIGAQTTFDPLKSIYATGWLYRRAISGSPSTFLLWGMWLIFAPSAILLALGLAAALRQSWQSFQFLLWTFTLFVFVLYVLVLIRMTKAYLRAREHKPGHCRKCGYNLVHLTVLRCPECGLRFSPDETPSGEACSSYEQIPSQVPDNTWHVPDCPVIPEAMFPIHCSVCGDPLRGTEDVGHCQGCGHAFDRRERLFEEHGPEVFCGATHAAPRGGLGSAGRGRAAVTTGVLVAVVACAMHWRLREDIPKTVWAVVFFLGVMTYAEWKRVNRGVGDNDDGDG